MQDIPVQAALREEWCVVDDSCNCRRIVRTRAAAERVLATGRLMPSREPGPLRLEHRFVTEWERA